jgi:hypothetical protein
MSTTELTNQQKLAIELANLRISDEEGCGQISTLFIRQGVFSISELAEFGESDIRLILAPANLSLVQMRRLMSAIASEKSSATSESARASAPAAEPDHPNASSTRTLVAVQEVVSEKKTNPSSARPPVAVQGVERAERAPRAEVVGEKKPNPSSARPPAAVQNPAQAVVPLSTRDYPSLALSSEVSTRKSKTGLLDDLNLFAKKHRDADASGGSTKSEVSSNDKTAPKSSERRDAAASGGSKQTEVVPSEEKPRSATIKDAVLLDCEDAQWNCLFAKACIPKPQEPQKPKAKAPLRFELPRGVDSSTKTEIMDYEHDIFELTQQISHLTKSHSDKSQRAKSDKRDREPTVIQILESILSKKSGLEDSLKSKKDSLKGLKEKLPKPEKMSDQESVDYANIVDPEQNPNVFNLMTQYFLLLSHLSKSHTHIVSTHRKKRETSKAGEATGEAGEATGEAGDVAKSEKSAKLEKSASAVVTVYRNESQLPSTKSLKSEEVIFFNQVRMFLQLLKLLECVTNFRSIFFVTEEVPKKATAEEESTEEVPKKATTKAKDDGMPFEGRIFVRFNKAVCGDDDEYPDETVRRKWAMHLVKVTEYFKDSTIHSDMTLNDALSKDNFPIVFARSSFRLKKPFIAHWRHSVPDLLATECRFASAVRGGSATENIENIVQMYHASMQSTSGRRPLATIGIQSMLTPEQYSNLQAIRNHKSFIDSKKKITEFLESSRVIQISDDENGTKYFTVLPLPNDE